jgi:4-amino-4-deoxy-L-arabinose transferase-like glycosyltransferase
MGSKVKRRYLIFRRASRRLLIFAPVLLPLLILIGTGMRGLDFGTHWDEKYYQIRPVKTMVTTGVLLPQYYGYPSLDYWVNTAALIPEILALRGKEDKPQYLLDALDGYPYLMRLRAVYLIITSLSVLWIYLLVVMWRQSWVEALLAGLFLALSWEVAYHLRWIATDGMLMQFGALTIFFTMLVRVQPENRRWLPLAAVAAALGCGTKYPGGLLLIPVLVAAYLSWDKKSYFALTSLLVKCGLIFAGVYLLTTPATVIQPIQFIKGLAYEIHHYSTGHAGHTISAGAEHGWRMFLYFSSVLFSRYALIAWFFFLLSVVGGYALAKESPKMALIFFCFPVFYVLYFCTQRAMVVRNLLVIVPFLAVLAARGTCFLWERLKLKGGKFYNFELNLPRALFAALLSVAFAINFGWLIYAAETITERNTDRFIREAAAYISANGDRRIFLSPRVRTHLTAIGSTRFENVTENSAEADRVLFYAHEGMSRYQDWQANNYWFTETWFGPYEVNFNVYPNWWGDDRIVVMTTARANEIGVLVVK